MQKNRYRRLKRACQKLKARCPLPELLERLGLGRHARSSCRSPLRNDETASWGIFSREGKHFWKDFGTEDGGDEIAFIARLKGWDEKKDFGRIVEFYDELAKESRTVDTTRQQPAEPKERKPDCGGLHRGTPEQFIRLSTLRCISAEALEHASNLGFLVFGQQLGFEVFGLTDQSSRLAEVRRLDGGLFPAIGSLQERKCHTLNGSNKSWPVGGVECGSKPAIALVEGLPDFLACFDFILREGKVDRVGVAGMLSAGCRIAGDAMLHFNGKRVRIYAHNDEAGINAARRWTEQLTGVASSIDYFVFWQFERINDLADLNRAVRCGNVQPGEVLP